MASSDTSASAALSLLRLRRFWHLRCDRCIQHVCRRRFLAGVTILPFPGDAGHREEIDTPKELVANLSVDLAGFARLPSPAKLFIYCPAM